MNNLLFFRQVALLKSASAARDALQAQNAALSRDCARLAEAAEQAEAVAEADQQLREDLEASRAEAAGLETQLDAASSELERLRGEALGSCFLSMDPCLTCPRPQTTGHTTTRQLHMASSPVLQFIGLFERYV